MKKAKIFLPLAVLGLIFGLVACGGADNQNSVKSNEESQENDGSKEGKSSAKEEKIVITAADSKTRLVIGDTVQLSASVEGVTWKANGDAVTINETGLVTAVALGDASISAEKEGYKTGRISISVVRPDPTAVLSLLDADHYAADGWWSMSFWGMEYGPGTSPVTSDYNDETNVYLGYFGTGDKETLTFTSDKAVKAELVVNMGSASSLTVSEAMSISLNGTALSLEGATFEGTSDYSIEFQEVSLGEVDILAGSNVMVFDMLSSSAPYLKNVDVYAKEAATIAIVPAPEKAAIVVEGEDQTDIALEVGDTHQIVSLTTEITYLSSDETVLTVSETGLITAVAVGKANVTLVKEGMLSARISVTVSAKSVSGQIIVEAEDGIPEESEIKAFAGWGSLVVSGEYIYTFPAGEVLNLTFTAETAGTMELFIVASAKTDASYQWVDTNLSEVFEIKFNDTTVSLENKTIEGSTSSGWTPTFVEVSLGDVEVKAGENTITVTALENGGTNLDYFKLTPKA